MGLRVFIALFAALGLAACATGESTPPPVAEPPLYDLTLPDEAKADGYIFDSSLLTTDALFVDAGFMSAEEIQLFLEHTPYGHRSFLADYTEGRTSVAQQIAEVAKTYQINPMVLLVKLQVETSLIFKTGRPSDYTLDRATGCGCPDDRYGCYSTDAGLFPQIECTGRLLRSYLEQIEVNGKTVSGWGPNKTKTTSDGIAITPRSAATAALYTYTPWVLQGQGGNWLLWNVHRKYSIKVQRDRPNHRWIGGPCGRTEDCGYEEAICLPGNRNGVGTCTLPCERVCPDSGALFTATTFCVGTDGFRRAPVEALCVAQCDLQLFPNNEGCRADHACKRLARYGEEDVTRAVCVPGNHDGESLEESHPGAPPPVSESDEASEQEDGEAEEHRNGPHGR